MTTIKEILFASSFLLFVSCTSESVPSQNSVKVTSSSSATESLNPSGDEPHFLVTIPDIHFSFPYWKELTPIKNVDYMSNPDRTGEYGFDLTGSGKTVFLSVVRYDRASDGVHDWSIPRSIPEALAQRIDTASCDLLQSDAVYLPVDFSHLHYCKALTTWNGSLPLIAAIGYGYPFESADFIQDTIVLFGKDYAYILSSLVDFPEFQKSLNDLWEKHLRDNPDTEFPNTQWDSFVKKASALVESTLQENSAEIQNNLGLLMTIARGMRLE